MTNVGMSLKTPALLVMVASLMAGCGSAGDTRPQVAIGGAASCAGLSSSQQLARATLVVVATALVDPTKESGSQRTLVSPARVRIDRYIKGRAPGVVEVETAVSPHHGELIVNADGIMLAAGQRWKLFLTGRHSPYQTSICAGSKRVV